jgi:predicted RNA binding protein YcfA (HicA-like mRNA interferase family)
MPPKIRELIQSLENAGFVNRGGKGSHRNFRHLKGIRITVSGKAGDDAKAYQLKDVKKALELVK